MTQEHKDLLLKDLCARLPYRIKGFAEHGVFKGIVTLRNINIDNDCQPIACYNNYSSLHVKVSEFKPYLFPLSSMTEEQRKELQELYFDYIPDEIFNDTEFVYHYDCIHLIDWLNANHFDYRNLINKNLAIDCTNLNIY